MFPYQIYQTLTDQRLSQLRAEARRHEMVAEARRARRAAAGQTSRAKDAAARLLALLRVRHDDRDRSTGISAAGAGPMGCVA